MNDDKKKPFKYKGALIYAASLTTVIGASAFMLYVSGHKMEVRRLNDKIKFLEEELRWATETAWDYNDLVHFMYERLQPSSEAWKEIEETWRRRGVE